MAGLTWQSRRDDIEVLEILDRFDGDEVSATTIGREFGRSKSAILGIVHRTMTHVDRVGNCRCTKPENRNGGMPRRWWAE